MKTFDWIIVAVSLVFFAMLFGLKVSFKPFKVSLEDWKYGLGWTLLIVGVSILIFDKGLKEYGEGYSKGLKDGSKLVIDKLNEAVDTLNQKKEVTL